MEIYFGERGPMKGPFNVYQGERFMGTVPNYPPSSISGIFNVRPADFKLAERNGERILEAHPSICPGDWGCIEGFQPADGREIDRSFADEFGERVRRGLSAVSAMDELIKNALNK